MEFDFSSHAPAFRHLGGVVAQRIEFADEHQGRRQTLQITVQRRQGRLATLGFVQARREAAQSGHDARTIQHERFRTSAARAGGAGEVIQTIVK